MEPVVVAVLVGVGMYMLLVALIPRKILAEPTGYTKSQLRELERESSGLSAHADDSENSVLREHIQNASLITRIFFTLPGVRQFYPRLLKADLAENTDTLFISGLVLFLLLVYMLRGMGLWSFIIAFIGIYAVVWWYVNRRIRKRNELFLNMFPDALDMIVRSMRSGYPLNAAVRMVADNMQPPVSEEFKRVADELAYGSALMDALMRLSYRVDEPDIRFFVVVLAVQQEVGGNLAEVLSNLSGIIRKRKHLRLKIKALTSEGRATAWVLGLLPLFEFVIIHFVSPKHLEPFFTTTLGHIMLATAIGIVLLGAFIVKQIINIEI